MRFFVIIVALFAVGDSALHAQQTKATYLSADNALANGEYQKAFKQAKELCQSRPSDINNLMLLGRTAFAAGNMQAAIKAYDEIVTQRPEFAPQLWQRGLALYYADKFEDGVRQFETHQTVNSQDVENAVWHLLCKTRAENIVEARKTMIPIKGDNRIPMSQIYEMFAGRLKATDVLDAASKTSGASAQNSARHKLQLYYAHLYIGLFHEINGDKLSCQESLKRAVKINPLPKNNFMGQVARVHLQLHQSKK